MSNTRNLKLKQRIENVRDKTPIRVVNFDLNDIELHFKVNLNSLKRHFKLADELVSLGKTDEAKDIWRTQIVFLESALDFYLHEITKFGMNKIFNNEWSHTEKFKNYTLRLSDVIQAISNPEDASWFVEHVNSTIMNESFMDFDSIRDQLNLIGIKVSKVADRAFHVQGCSEPTLQQLKRHLNRIFRRRNHIVHQSDRSHLSGVINDITKVYVEEEIEIIEKIVNSIHHFLENYESEMS